MRAHQAEEWRPVAGYEGYYEVSSLGRVRALDREKATPRGLFRWPAKMLSPFADTNGYLYVNLGRGGKSAKKLAVHAIVLEAFVGPRPDGMQCLHGDGDRANPALSNLRWGTATENAADRRRHGTHLAGERAPRAKLTDELVSWVKQSAQSSIELGRVLGVSSSTVRAIRLGQNWGAHQ